VRDALGAAGLLLALASIGGTLILLVGALLERDRAAD
jgi:hypothetical protein